MIRPVVLSGPSGSGKSTILKKIMEKHANAFAFSISHTTRKPRPGEENEKDYHFVEKQEIHKSIKENKFLEHAEFAGNVYGTSLDAVETVQMTGKICILDLDIEGVKSVKKSSLNSRFVFIGPPSMEILEKRLRDRGTETEDKLQARLSRAQKDIDYSTETGVYDLVIVNDVLDIAVTSLEKFLEDDLKKFNDA